MSRARVCFKRGVVVSAAWVVGVCGTVGVANADRLEVVARAGDTVSSGTQTFTVSRVINYQGRVSAPAIADSGHIAYDAQLIGAGYALVREINDQDGSVIARTGTNAAGGTTAPLFSGFSDFVLGPGGQLAFSGSLSLATGVVTTSNDLGWWLGAPGNVRVLAREGSALAGGTGTCSTFSDISLARQSSNRWFSVRAGLSGSGVTTLNNRAFVDVEGLQTETLAQSGTAAPDTGGANFYDLQRSMDDSGNVVLYSTLQGVGVTTTNNSGIWVRREISSTAQEFQRLVRTGEAAPGAANGAVFRNLYTAASTPMVNAGRRVAFMGATVTATGVIGGGVWLAVPPTVGHGAAALTPIVVTGQAAPGLPGVVIAGPTSPSNQRGFFLADNDKVLVWTTMSGSGVNASNNLALWSSEPAASGRTLRLIARAGQSIPGGDGSVSLSSYLLGSMTRVNRRGDAVFFGKLQGTSVSTDTDYGVFTYVNGELRMPLREGQSLPGATGFWAGRIGDYVSSVFFNESGQVVFTLGAHHMASSIVEDVGVVAIDQNGRANAVAIASNELTLVGGSTTVIGRLSIGANALNNAGQFVFGAESPGEAVYRYTIEPNTNPVPTCPADWDRSGQVSQEDIFAFLQDYFRNQADISGDGTTTVQDIYDFLTAWHGGC